MEGFGRSSREGITRKWDSLRADFARDDRTTNGAHVGKIRREAAATGPSRKAIGSPSSQARPTLARAELVDKVTRERFESELDAALKRRPTNEAKVGGALRAMALVSPALRASLAETATVLVRRRSFARELYAASIRSLAECEDRATTALLRSALAADDAGGVATLSAACFSRDPSLAGLLAKIAASRQSHVAFAAETARVARRESNGAHLLALAPMIKESHRISLCVELFVPLARSAPVPVHVSPALNVLRGAERHLGRWLVLADVAAKSGDPGPAEEATTKATSGPSSARSAWALVAWALAEASARGAEVTPPETRPTVELVARLSDRPSADRDTTFLFRMARARATAARPMLETLASSSSNGAPNATGVKGVLNDENAIRAAIYLARDHGRTELRDALADAAQNAKRDELKGLAVAALWDSGDRERARELAENLVVSKCIGNVAWGALVRMAAARSARSPSDAASSCVVEETPFRWIQLGWLE